MKSSQCGISAAAVSLALYAADVWGAHVLYVLPTEDLAQGFSDTRVKTAISSDPYLRSRVHSTDAKSLKRLGAGNLYFVGSGSEARALSVPADVLILDEFDRLDQRHLAKFRSRLSAPTSMKLKRYFSNPSFPEAGIHTRWLSSDQRTWLVRCPSCRLEAAITPGHRDDQERPQTRALLGHGSTETFDLLAKAVRSGVHVPGVTVEPGTDDQGTDSSTMGPRVGLGSRCEQLIECAGGLGLHRGQAKK
jgi:phage terminase large subunit GpA-like protein